MSLEINTYHEEEKDESNQKMKDMGDKDDIT